jgi:hypothetical protein
MRCAALILRSDAQRRVAKDAALVRDLVRQERPNFARSRISGASFHAAPHPG